MITESKLQFTKDYTSGNILEAYCNLRNKTKQNKTKQKPFVKWKYANDLQNENMLMICKIENCNLQNGNMLMICKIEICNLQNGNLWFAKWESLPKIPQAKRMNQ